MGKVIKRKAVSSGSGTVADVLTKKLGGNKQQKGYVKSRSERGSGLKFKVETFATISNFSPGTRIKYGPNVKTPGSKSHVRYAQYMKANTVGEALKLGSKKADFFWELERGYYQVLGTTRSEAQEVAAIGRKAYDDAEAALASFVGPRGLAMNSFDDPRAATAASRRQRCRVTLTPRCCGYWPSSTACGCRRPPSAPPRTAQSGTWRMCRAPRTWPSRRR